MNETIDLSGTFAGDLHDMLGEAARQGPLAVDAATGATVVLRQRDLETLAHDQRLEGIGLAVFDVMGVTDGPLRDWYGGLMFTTEGDCHRRVRSLVSRAFTPGPSSRYERRLPASPLRQSLWSARAATLSRHSRHWPHG